MEQILSVLQQINRFLWNGPMLFLLLGTHIFFSLKLGFIQKKIKKAISLSLSSDCDSSGNASSYSTLTTTLAATLGTGNIVGISTAISLGGPGAVFWCWLTGIFGMATTYAECYLSLTYRVKNSDGTYKGGPMYAIEFGLKSRLLAILFSICTILIAYGMGCSTQARAITNVTAELGIPSYVSGIIVAVLIGLVLIGGVKQIQKLCTKLVPAMAVFYILGCIIVLYLNRSYLFDTIVVIFAGAFKPSSIAGGVVSGTFTLAARYGISRGLFTNEAGLGSAAIAACDSHNKNIHEQSLVSMSATFWDTVVMCAITGLVIVSTILRLPDSIQGLDYSEYTTAAFAQIPFFGTGVLWVSLVAFASATLIGWSYIGEKAANYLFHGKGISIYRFGYILMIFFGSIMSLDLVWEGSDFLNALIILPNIISLFVLRKQIKP